MEIGELGPWKGTGAGPPFDVVEAVQLLGFPRLCILLQDSLQNISYLLIIPLLTCRVTQEGGDDGLCIRGVKVRRRLCSHRFPRILEEVEVGEGGESVGR